jgi:hypothetical protein
MASSRLLYESDWALSSLCVLFTNFDALNRQLLIAETLWQIKKKTMKKSNL